MPDEFLVKRVRQEATVVARAGLLKAGLLNAQDLGPSFFIYRTVFDLESPRQPQVRWPACEQWDHPAMGNHLSIREIRLALGKVMTLTLPSGATGEAR
jgi:hypothetical protein